MPTTNFTALLPEVLPEVHGAPRALVVNAIRKAARRFCERSTYWVADHALITTVTDENGNAGEYDLTLPAGTEMVTVRQPAFHKAEPIYQKTERWLYESFDPKWRDKTGTQADWFLMLAPTTLRLVPYPVTAQTDALRVTMILKPSGASTGMDTAVYDEWYEVLAAGALSALQKMHDTRWTNLKQAEINRQLFNNGIDEAHAKITAGYNQQRADRRSKVRGYYF